MSKQRCSFGFSFAPNSFLYDEASLEWCHCEALSASELPLSPQFFNSLLVSVVFVLLCAFGSTFVLPSSQFHTLHCEVSPVWHSGNVAKPLPKLREGSSTYPRCWVWLFLCKVTNCTAANLPVPLRLDSLLPLSRTGLEGLSLDDSGCCVLLQLLRQLGLLRPTLVQKVKQLLRAGCHSWANL